jgi:hypothetical protein
MTRLLAAQRDLCRGLSVERRQRQPELVHSLAPVVGADLPWAVKSISCPLFVSYG